MFARVSKAVVGIVAASLLLTACDPPMPPEVRAALEEQTFTCESGETQFFATETVAAVAGDWTASIELNCPGMTLVSQPVDSEAVELAVGGERSGAYAAVPFAVDATVLVVALSDITDVALSAEVVEKIWAGEITAWDDPAIVKLNPNFAMPSTPITFGIDPAVTRPEVFEQWLSRLAGREIRLGTGTAGLDSLAEGSLVLTDYSTAMELSATMAGIVSDKIAVAPNIESINSGASMFKTKADNGIISSELDPKAKPIPPAGVNAAPAPYQAVWLLELKLFGTDSLKTRAAARYLLRQDSQGSLGMSNVVAIPENLRLAAIEVVSVGLPKPQISISPSQ